MIILIAGASYVGKTLLAQKLLEKYKIPYLSIDHLKMGIYRSNNDCGFSPESADEIITEKLWPILREIIKTNIESKQNIIIEGCYFPYSIEDMDYEYLEKIMIFCIGFSEQYIRKNLSTKIYDNRSVMENREYGFFEDMEKYILENEERKQKYRKNGIKYFEINEDYEKEITDVYQWIEKEIHKVMV
jgi:putative acetyltransferase